MEQFKLSLQYSEKEANKIIDDYFQLLEENLIEVANRIQNSKQLFKTQKEKSVEEFSKILKDELLQHVNDKLVNFENLLVNYVEHAKNAK